MTDLGLEIFRTTGRATKAPTAVLVRELDRSDMEMLNAEKGSVAPPLKRLSERHHALARNLASGMAPSEAAIVCGYVPSSVSILLDDPSFKELLEFYRDSVDKQYSDLHERLSGLAMDAADVLSSRLEETPDDVSIGQLIEITKMGADRTGHGPTSTTNQNVNVNIATRLEEARKRVAMRGKLIEHEDNNG